jgi:hypothetical protein
VRKDRYKKDLRGVDPQSKEYWEEVLRREGLTIRAGESKRLVYVGNSNDLQDIHEKVLAGTEGPKESLNTGEK